MIVNPDQHKGKMYCGTVALEKLSNSMGFTVALTEEFSIYGKLTIVKNKLLSDNDIITLDPELSGMMKKLKKESVK